MTANISDVNEALGVAQNVVEYAFAEAVLIGASKSDLEATSVTFEQNKEQYEELSGKLDALTIYYEGLAKMLAENELPSYNEATAAEEAKESAELAKTLKEQSELMEKVMEKMIETTGNLQMLANQLHTRATALKGKAEAVINRN